MAGGNIKLSVLTGLRAASQGLVLLALITTCLHYAGLDWRRWDEESVKNADEAIHTMSLADGADLLVDPSYYHTNVSYGRYDGDDFERKIAHRVWMLPVGEGYTEFWSKHNNGFLGGSKPKHPDSDDYMIIDVIDDLSLMLWISFGWLASIMVIGVIEVIVDSRSPSASSLLQGPVGAVYYFVKALEDQDGADMLDNVLTGDGDAGIIWEALSASLRGVAFLLREGFFIFVSSISVVYAFVVLYSFQGPCASDVELPGRCSVQRTPVPTHHFVLLLIVAIVGRIASQYNSSNGSWESKRELMARKAEAADGTQGDQKSPEQWQRIFASIKDDLNSVTIQMFGCGVSIVCSGVILWVLGSAFYSIGEDRRFPYESIWWTVFTLELSFILLNAGVYLLSNVSFFSNLQGLKLYIEGRLFGALFVTAVTLSIYMSLRRGINMHGTLSTQSDMVRFGHYGGSGGSTPDTLHGLSTAEFASMQLTFEGAFHGKQLSAHDEHCHYIPKYVFKDPEDYSYNQTLCAHGHDGKNALLHNKQDIDNLNNTVTQEKATYDALVQAVADAEADLQAAVDASSSPADLASNLTAVNDAKDALDYDGGANLAAAEKALADLLKSVQKETLFGTCCLRTEFENEGSNGTTVYTGLWVAVGGLLLQIVLLGVSAAVTGGNLGDGMEDGIQAVVDAFGGNGATGDGEDDFRSSHIPRGFKTIRVV